MFTFLITLFYIFHALHVSVSDISYNSKSKSAEVTVKVFMDDLEVALKKTYNKKIDITHAPEKVRDSILRIYFQKNFSMKFDQAVKKYSFLGTELDKEAIWCYLEVKSLKKFNRVWVKNTILQEAFEEQINLVNVTLGEDTKSAKLDASSPFDEVVFN